MSIVGHNRSLALKLTGRRSSVFVAVYICLIRIREQQVQYIKVAISLYLFSAELFTFFSSISAMKE